MPNISDLNKAVEAFAKEGYERFKYTHGGTLAEYAEGAKQLLKGNNKLIEHYAVQQEREDKLNLIAFNNIIEKIKDEVRDGINQINNDYFRKVAQKYRDDVFKLIDNVSEKTAIKFGEFYRDNSERYMKLENLIYGTIFASNNGVADSQKHERGMRGIHSILQAFRVAFTKRETAEEQQLLNALQLLEDVFKEVEI